MYTLSHRLDEMIDLKRKLRTCSFLHIEKYYKMWRGRNANKDVLFFSAFFRELKDFVELFSQKSFGFFEFDDGTIWKFRKSGILIKIRSLF